MKCSFTIERNVVAAMALFESGDGSRPAICGTHYECRGNCITLIATDGRRMATYLHETHVKFTDPTDTLATFTVDAAPVLKLYKVGSYLNVQLADDGSRIEFSLQTAMVRGEDRHFVSVNNIERPSEGKRFPEWRQVIPTAPISPKSSFNFNPELMLDFVKAGILIRGSGNVQAQIVAHESRHDFEQSPYSIFIGSRQFYGMIMPMRFVEADPVAPDWARPLPKPAPVAPVPAPEAPAPMPEAAPVESIRNEPETPSAPVA